jgi:hypothetical protein
MASLTYHKKPNNISGIQAQSETWVWVLKIAKTSALSSRGIQFRQKSLEQN